MSQNQLLPVYILQAISMGASFVSDAVKLEFEDNVGIQAVWTGTPTGVLTVEVSMDPDILGWQTIPFTPTPAAPSGSAGSDWFELNQSPAAFVRLKYVRTSGTGTINAKIALKSV
jgi:hypothetical protein